MEIPKEKLLEMYRNLLTARRVGKKLYEGVLDETRR